MQKTEDLQGYYALGLYLVRLFQIQPNETDRLKPQYF